MSKERKNRTIELKMSKERENRESNGMALQQGRNQEFLSGGPSIVLKRAL